MMNIPIRELEGFEADDVIGTLAKKVVSFVGSLMPGADSTPLELSTASGRATRIASATLSGVNPPASTRRTAASITALFDVFGAGLVLRVVHNDYGLPYVYYVDEGSHFTKRAVEMFRDLSPSYFQNPSAFTYLLHLVYRVVAIPNGGGETVIVIVPDLVTRAAAAARATYSYLKTRLARTSL